MNLILRTLWIICAAPLALGAAEGWETALAQMPLGTKLRELNCSNCVDVMLRAFQSNGTVKALIFMPGATDEFYMFRRAKAELTNRSPSLFDAVAALTNQTLIRATFYSPLLLLHTDEDPLEPLIQLEHAPTADKLQRTPFVPHVVWDDRDWDFVQPMLKKALRMDIRPWRHSYDSWHFYRHSFAAWGLSRWEALQAVGLAGKTSVIIQRRRIIFEGDERVRSTPRFDALPR